MCLPGPLPILKPSPSPLGAFRRLLSIAQLFSIVIGFIQP